MYFNILRYHVSLSRIHLCCKPRLKIVNSSSNELLIVTLQNQCQNIIESHLFMTVQVLRNHGRTVIYNTFFGEYNANEHLLVFRLRICCSIGRQKICKYSRILRSFIRIDLSAQTEHLYQATLRSICTSPKDFQFMCCFDLHSFISICISQKNLVEIERT